MNQLNKPSDNQAPPQLASDKSFQQFTQQGKNQVNVTEHNTAVGIPNLSGHLTPSTVWGRWFLRWLGFFSVGCTLPFLTATSIGGLAAPALLLTLLALAGGYCLVDRRAIGVVLVCTVIVIVGAFVALPTFLNLLIGAF
jgi:hypothetical protein